MLNLFYQEPDDDRWFPYDRFPRAVIRRLVRGPRRPGGQTRVFLNLCEGLRRIGVTFRVNDFAFSKRNPSALACIVGKPFLLDKMKWKNPILFGAAVYSHPIDDPELLQRLPVKKVLVPGPWMREMCKPHWGDTVVDWPVGIDTELWAPAGLDAKSIDVLIYDKVRWEHQRYEEALIEPIRDTLRQSGISSHEIRYGHYREEDFSAALSKCRAMIFLCEHETQGIAYQQALSSGVPIFAWDRGGPWRDPSYYPHKVVFAPVSSVPYWDERCGMKFKDASEFADRWGAFWERAKAGSFAPRDYVLEELTLEKCARRYVEIAQSVS
jgi:glycosyltransferase involved in cell wall biosynthesis